MSRPSLMERLTRMNQRSLFGTAQPDSAAPAGGAGEGEAATPPDAERAEAVQRIQIGLFGIGSMVLLVGLASIIGSQADLTDEAAVPEAAPTTEPSPAPSQANPLADAGVVPDIAAEPSPSPSPAPLDLPPPPRPAGNAAPAQ
jgi:hypothetical protein